MVASLKAPKTADPTPFLNKEMEEKRRRREVRLRDYFAGQALQAVLQNITGKASSHQEIGDAAAQVSYVIADAMLEARKK